MESQQEYEFNEPQNKTILELAKTLQFVGAVALVVTLVFAVGFVSSLLHQQWSELFTQGMFVIFTFSMAGLMAKAGKEFQAIATTEGKDIEHLMVALDNLRQMYSILSVIIMLIILLGLIGLAVSLLSSGGTTVAQSGPASMLWLWINGFFAT